MKTIDHNNYCLLKQIQIGGFFQLNHKLYQRVCGSAAYTCVDITTGTLSRVHGQDYVYRRLDISVQDLPKYQYKVPAILTKKMIHGSISNY